MRVAVANTNKMRVVICTQIVWTVLGQSEGRESTDEMLEGWRS